MSNFRSKAFNPASKRVEVAEYCDNYYGQHRYGIRFDDGCVHPEAQCGIDAAATQLDALQARVKELEFDIAGFRLINVLHKNSTDDAESRADALQARVKELEAFASSESEAANKLLGNGLSLVDRLENAESRATRLQLERDEAYERLKPFAQVAGYLTDHEPDTMDIFESPCANEIKAGHLRAARDLVRRLAGPEKEKKE